MSTILNALKRVEAKSRAEDGQQIPAAMAGRTAVSGKKLRLGLVLTLAVVTLLAGAAFLWFYTDRPSGESASFEAAPPEPRAEKAPRERTRETPAPAPTTGASGMIASIRCMNRPQYWSPHRSAPACSRP